MTDTKRLAVLLWAVGMLLAVVWTVTACEARRANDLAKVNVELMEQVQEMEVAAADMARRTKAAESGRAEAEARAEELQRQVEALTAQVEDVTFGYDEVVEATGWDGDGTFRLTFYCPCERCCGEYADGITATGSMATAGRTVAVDPAVIPLGSTVRIGGHDYVAEDTGVHGHTIDVFVDDHQEALRLGTYKTTVQWRENA